MSINQDLLEEKPDKKVVDCIRIINPLPESLDDLILKRADFIRRGYMTEIAGERLSKNIDIVKLIVYERVVNGK